VWHGCLWRMEVAAGVGELRGGSREVAMARWRSGESGGATAIPGGRSADRGKLIFSILLFPRPCLFHFVPSTSHLSQLIRHHVAHYLEAATPNLPPNPPLSSYSTALPQTVTSYLTVGSLKHVRYTPATCTVQLPSDISRGCLSHRFAHWRGFGTDDARRDPRWDAFPQVSRSPLDPAAFLPIQHIVDSQDGVFGSVRGVRGVRTSAV
jgi:hypothetical protein